MHLGYLTHVAGHGSSAAVYRDTIALAVAERTSTLRLGTAVVAAPLEDPRRLAEDAAVLDELSGGRVELGIGAGADAVAAAAFGRDHDRRYHDCTAVADRLCALLTEPGLVPRRTPGRVQAGDALSGRRRTTNHGSAGRRLGGYCDTVARASSSTPRRTSATRSASCPRLI